LNVALQKLSNKINQTIDVNIATRSVAESAIAWPTIVLYSLCCIVFIALAKGIDKMRALDARALGRCLYWLAHRHVVAACILTGSAGVAFALSGEVARETCSNNVGKPFVQSCMRAGGNTLESCRARSTPHVRACIEKALNAANGRPNVPLELPNIIAPKAGVAIAHSTNLLAPPRTIADITAILDREKPDWKKLEQLKAEADREPTGKETGEALVHFYYDRSTARADLGRTAESIADTDKAIEAGRNVVSPGFMNRMMEHQGVNYELNGDLKKGVEAYQRQLRFMEQHPDQKGLQFYANRTIVLLLVYMGDISQAEIYRRRNELAIKEMRTTGLPRWRATYDKVGQMWESELDIGRGLIAEGRGHYAEAEAAYRQGEQRRRAAIAGVLTTPNPPTMSSMLLAADFTILWQARMEARQGRLSEAEADARRALLARLKDTGKYHITIPHFVMGLADILVEQGRYAEAEKLARAAVEIDDTIGVSSDTQWSVLMLSQLANVLTLQDKQSDATAVYQRIDKSIKKWDVSRRQVFELNPLRIQALYASGQIDAGIAAAEQLVKRSAASVGETHFETAAARGTLAMGLALAGRDEDAAREFKLAIPVLMSAEQENTSGDNATSVAARTQRFRAIVESYFLLRTKASGSSSDVGEETFALADAVRARSVQQALAEASARAATKDPALAELVRKEQDLVKQVDAELGILNNLLSLPSAERDEKSLQEINASITSLRLERDKARQEITQRFPAYADLIAPKPPSVGDIRTALADGEAMLSFYFGQSGSFVWAVPKAGPIAFAKVNASSGDIESRIRKLREALEPQAAMISDIPPFDLDVAYELYSLLLKPVETGWKPARNLIVVTNGALGLLPLSLLPTAPSAVPHGEDPLFAEYRRVPWLARTHAVTMVPSSASLRTLRQLPPGKGGRNELVAFGDPLFSPEQAVEAAKARPGEAADADATTTRGMPLSRRSSPKLGGVDSAELALLPRLPDTAAELRSIALALQADPSKALNLGKDANEQAVKTMDLSGFKVLVFATHGLVPGELDGLTQPALALTAPAVAGVEGDGLLTMEEILALKLDADWVVLSACNTGAGEGAGAEAASGLGRAFFYAGTRAILVTNWSVHSQSAKELVSDLFRRQAEDPRLTRGEALRQAMMALMDGPGYLSANGKTEFVYAHPLFWAPYSIIGDGGVR